MTATVSETSAEQWLLSDAGSVFLLTCNHADSKPVLQLCTISFFCTKISSRLFFCTYLLHIAPIFIPITLIIHLVEKIGGLFGEIEGIIVIHLLIWMHRNMWDMKCGVISVIAGSYPRLPFAPQRLSAPPHNVYFLSHDVDDLASVYV